MFTSANTENYQFQTLFRSGLKKEEEPVFLEFEKYLSEIDMPAALVAFNTSDNHLDIYLEEDKELLLIDSPFLDITNYDLGKVICEKWRDLTYEHNCLHDFNDKIEVKIQNFKNRYQIYLAEACLDAVNSSINLSKLAEKPKVVLNNPGVYTVIYKNQLHYEMAFTGRSIFQLLEIIEDDLGKGDSLNFYKPRSLKLEVINAEMWEFDLSDSFGGMQPF